VITALMGFGVISPTLGLSLAFGGLLLAVDLFAWRGVAKMFDRERLVTASKATTARRPATALGRRGTPPRPADPS
jgi:hypothetical protein